jgi:hypothetical protein
VNCVTPTDDDLQGDAARTQDDMVAAGGVQENVLDIRESEQVQSRPIGVFLTDGLGRESQTRGAGLGQPDGMGLLGCQSWIGESSRGPTPRHAGHGLAAA